MCVSSMRAEQVDVTIRKDSLGQFDVENFFLFLYHQHEFEKIESKLCSEDYIKCSSS